MVTIKSARIATAVLLLLSAGACTTDGPVTADESPFDHSAFDPRPHDYRTLGLDLLSSTVRPMTVLMNNEPDRCGEQEFPFEHTFYVADQAHTAWHRYEEDSFRTFDNVIVTIDEYEVEIECHPHPKDSDDLYCITRVSLGLDLETSGGGGPTLTDHGWISFFWISYPESCSEANHRVDYAATQATEGAIGELFKRVEATDKEYLGLTE